MIRNFKSVIRNTQAVSEVIGIVIMLIIVIGTATTLHISMSQTADSKLRLIPMVSMKQNSDDILIMSIQYGPIIANEVIIKVFDSSGSYVCDGDIHTKGTNVASGDTITINGLSSDTYTVRMIYLNTQVGTTKYIIN